MPLYVVCRCGVMLHILTNSAVPPSASNPILHNAVYGANRLFRYASRSELHFFFSGTRGGVDDLFDRQVA
jgi:hypothetical protein